MLRCAAGAVDGAQVWGTLGGEGCWGALPVRLTGCRCGEFGAVDAGRAAGMVDGMQVQGVLGRVMLRCAAGAVDGVEARVLGMLGASPALAPSTYYLPPGAGGAG
eukprot:355126-Chlamydomonas_euryale.AAC.1